MRLIICAFKLAEYENASTYPRFIPERLMMEFAHSERSLVQSLVREEVIILQGTDLKSKNKAFLLSLIRVRFEIVSSRRADINTRWQEKTRKFPSCDSWIAFRSSCDSISFRLKFGSNFPEVPFLNYMAKLDKSR